MANSGDLETQAQREQANIDQLKNEQQWTLTNLDDVQHQIDQHRDKMAKFQQGERRYTEAHGRLQ